MKVRISCSFCKKPTLHMDLGEDIRARYKCILCGAYNKLVDEFETLAAKSMQGTASLEDRLRLIDLLIKQNPELKEKVRKKYES